MAEFVYFIMHGYVHNSTTDRYLKSGNIINHDCIINNTAILYETKALTDVTVLKYSKEIFK